MQKILYLLLHISVASFGQSDKVKLNANTDSIYKSACFTLNDSVSAFKLSKFINYPILKAYQFGINGTKYRGNFKSPLVSITEDPFYASDTGNIEKYIEHTIRDGVREYRTQSMKESITIIGDNYRAYLVEITKKKKKNNAKLFLYILTYKDSFIVLGIKMNETKDSPYYLHEFNKLVNTIRFK
jgi:hypothetical protein